MEEEKYNSGIGQLGMIKEKLQTLVINERYAEDVKAKQAATLPQPPIDKHSFEMGKAETIDRIYRAIEEGLVLMSQSYDEGKITPSELDFLVMFSDSLKARFREILKIRKYTSTATTPQE